MKKPRSDEYRTNISGSNNHFFGKTHSAESKTKISLAMGSSIFVYSYEGFLVNTFCSVRKATLNFNISRTTILIYAKNSKLFKNKWILSISANNFPTDSINLKGK